MKSGSYARGDYREDSDIDIKPIAEYDEHFRYWLKAYLVYFLFPVKI